MHKVLFLCQQRYYITKMSRVRFHSMEAIAKVTDFTWSGPGWPNYDEKLTVQENINKIYEGQDKPDLVVAYKPFDLKEFNKVEQKTCIRYNEMYDHKWTLEEINGSRPDVIICHHLNDMREYEELFKENPLDFDTKMVNIPHSAEGSVFYDQNLPNRPFDCLLVGAVGINTMLGDHYPLRSRMFAVLGAMSNLGYNCGILRHPGGEHMDAYTSKYAKDFATTINQAKIAVTCTGAPNSRYGKYVEVPMCGTAIAGDIPGEDQENFKKFVIELNTRMTDQEMIDKLTYFLDNESIRQEYANVGKEWSKSYTQEKYAERFVEMLGEL